MGRRSDRNSAAQRLGRFWVIAVVATWLFAAIPLPGTDFPDTIRFHRRGPGEGLSNAVVTAVVQDHRGFIWIGTQDGLNRFDGYEFEVFRPRLTGSGFSVPRPDKHASGRQPRCALGRN